MYSYIPIIDLELIDYTKISIKKTDKIIKILYNYDNTEITELNIKINSAKIGLQYNKENIQIYSEQLLQLRNYIDELYKQNCDSDSYSKLRDRIKVNGETNDKVNGETNDKVNGETNDKVNGETNRVTVNFITNYSTATLIPLKKSSYETKKIRMKEDFTKTLQLYYPHINFNIVGDFILKIFISKNNNFCSFLIFDSEFSYIYNKNRIKINKNISYVQKNIDSIEI
jgi:hypothetical protein